MNEPPSSKKKIFIFNSFTILKNKELTNFSNDGLNKHTTELVSYDGK
jgi:hypothetical protein